MPTDAPDLDAERDVDLRRHWDTITRHWWIVVGGLVAGIVVGYLISLGGAQVYKAKAVVYLGQPLSQGGVQVQSQATNPSTVKEIVTAESTIGRVARDAGLRPDQLRGHDLDAGGRPATSRGSGRTRSSRSPSRATPAGRSLAPRTTWRGRSSSPMRSPATRRRRSPTCSCRSTRRRPTLSTLNTQPEGAAGGAQERLRPLDERAPDRARPAQRPAAAAADDHRPAHDQPAAARARQGRRGAGDHDARRGDEDDRAQPPQHGARRGR